MVATYSNSGKQAINADAIKEVMANAVFESSVVSVKGATSKIQSRFADPKPIEPKNERVLAVISIDVGQLPQNEKAMMVDLFDRYGELKNGKLSISQNYQKEDFDADRSQQMMMGFIENKVNKAIGAMPAQTLDSTMNLIPEETKIGVNEKSKDGILSWLKQAVTPKQQPSNEQSFGR